MEVGLPRLIPRDPDPGFRPQSRPVPIPRDWANPDPVGTLALALDLVIPTEFQHLDVLNFLPKLSSGPLRLAALFECTLNEIKLAT